MKLWKKSYEINEKVEKYTVGEDYIIDQKLVIYDCNASIAHAKMLHKIGLLTAEEFDSLIIHLQEIINLSKNGEFIIKPEDEDCHTAIENYLTSKNLEAGQKIHTGRSRNDQVLTAIRLYEKKELQDIKTLLMGFKEELSNAIKLFGNIEIPGYTHMQKAMPTTVGSWLSSFYYAVDDNIILLETVYKIIDQSPLGSGAGFGIPTLALDTEYTAKIMGFSKPFSCPIHIHSTRGKFEGLILGLLSQIMFDLNKFATDVIVFSTVEFGFMKLADELCTGSSIMPQKKNPDLLELMRAYYHVICGNEVAVKGIISNLISGYNRDLQLIKKPLFSSIDITKGSLDMAALVVNNISFDEKKCKAAMTEELYATQEAYELVLKDGVPFRKAYKQIGKKYEKK